MLAQEGLVVLLLLPSLRELREGAWCGVCCEVEVVVEYLTWSGWRAAVDPGTMFALLTSVMPVKILGELIELEAVPKSPVLRERWRLVFDRGPPPAWSEDILLEDGGGMIAGLFRCLFNEGSERVG